MSKEGNVIIKWIMFEGGVPKFLGEYALCDSVVDFVDAEAAHELKRGDHRMFFFYLHDGRETKAELGFTSYPDGDREVHVKKDWQFFDYITVTPEMNFGQLLKKIQEKNPRKKSKKNVEG